jgi:hypothetical protein
MKLKITKNYLKLFGFIIGASIAQYLVELYIKSTWYSNIGVISGVGLFGITIYFLYAVILCGDF